MTIQLKPELEQVIAQAIQEGVIHDAGEALDITLEVLRDRLSKGNAPQNSPQSGRSLLEVFEAVKGLADDLDFSRNPSTGRPVDLS